MTKTEAAAISKWRYPGQYAFYNLDANQETVVDLLDGSYYTVFRDNGKLMGFYCYGKSAQVLCSASAAIYKDTSYLDFGLGMAPHLCGKGLGLAFVQSCLQFGFQTYGFQYFRLTVASFNERAIKVYQKLGFKFSAYFERENQQGIVNFQVMLGMFNKV